MFLGELIALFVALSWTATALFAEVGSKRMGSLPFNTIRMTMSLVLLMVTLWLVMGVPYPRHADGGTPQRASRRRFSPLRQSLSSLRLQYYSIRKSLSAKS